MKGFVGHPFIINIIDDEGVAIEPCLSSIPLIKNLKTY
jgi:hypothetical protein